MVIGVCDIVAAIAGFYLCHESDEDYQLCDGWDRANGYYSSIVLGVFGLLWTARGKRLRSRFFIQRRNHSVNEGPYYVSVPENQIAPRSPVVAASNPHIIAPVSPLAQPQSPVNPYYNPNGANFDSPINPNLDAGNNYSQPSWGGVAYRSAQFTREGEASAPQPGPHYPQEGRRSHLV